MADATLVVKWETFAAWDVDGARDAAGDELYETYCIGCGGKVGVHHHGDEDTPGWHEVAVVRVAFEPKPRLLCPDCLYVLEAVADPAKGFTDPSKAPADAGQ